MATEPNAAPPADPASLPKAKRGSYCSPSSLPGVPAGTRSTDTSPARPRKGSFIERMGESAKKVAVAMAMTPPPSPRKLAFEHFTQYQVGRRIVERGTGTREEYDYGIKVSVLGRSGVGKTSLVRRLTRSEFEENHKATIGVEMAVYRYQPFESDARVHIQLWDTAGQERYQAVIGAYYRGTHGVVVVYDIAEAASWDAVSMYISEAQDKCGTDDTLKQPLIIVIGNKNDTPPSERTVSAEMAKKFCDERNYLYFETSAKDGTHVERAFHEFFEFMYRFRLRPAKATSESAPGQSQVPSGKTIRLGTSDGGDSKESASEGETARIGRRTFGGAQQDSASAQSASTACFC